MGLEVVITEDMAKRYAALRPLVNRRFFLKERDAIYPGTCIITGERFQKGTKVGHQKVFDKGHEITLIAVAVEVRKQMQSKPNAQSFREQKPDGGHCIPDDLISAQQREATEIFTGTSNNLIVESRAGGGKTTFLRHLASFRKANEKYCYTAFNRKNAIEGKKKLPIGVPSMTSHSFMTKVIRQHYKIPKEPFQGKTWVILNDLFPHFDSKQRKMIRSAAYRLTSLAKNFACKPDDLTAIRSVMTQYEFDLEKAEDYDTVVELTSDVLKKSTPGKENGFSYDYDDMLWWPAVMELPMPKYDVILADEVQDFNACQLDMMRKLGEQGAKLVIVGDPYQAVYGFRGADSKAFEKASAILENSRGAKRVLFPVNYRCDQAIIEFVKAYTHVKDIEYAPKAKEGSVRIDLTYNEVLDLLASEVDTCNA